MVKRGFIYISIVRGSLYLYFYHFYPLDFLSHFHGLYGAYVGWKCFHLKNVTTCWSTHLPYLSIIAHTGQPSLPFSRIIPLWTWRRGGNLGKLDDLSSQTEMSSRCVHSLLNISHDSILVGFATDHFNALGVQICSLNSSPLTIKIKRKLWNICSHVHVYNS